MAYHTTLTNSQEFTNALRKSRELAYNITMTMRQIPGTDPDFEVFPYTCVTFAQHFPPPPSSLLTLHLPHPEITHAAAAVFFQGDQRVL